MEEKEHDEINELNENINDGFNDLLEELKLDNDTINSIKSNLSQNDKYLSLDYNVFYNELKNPYLRYQGEKEKLSHSYENKENVLKAYHHVLYKVKSGEYISDSIRKKLGIDEGRGNVDFRAVGEFSLLIGPKTLDEFKSNKAKYFDEEIKTVLTFSKYPKVEKTNKLIDDYFKKQKQTVSSYLDKVNKFYFDDVEPIFAKYNYKIDFSAMDESEIYTLISAFKMSQDYFIFVNPNIFSTYFNEKFSSFEEWEKHAKVCQNAKCLSQIIAHELSLYGIDGSKLQLGDRFTFQYNPNYVKQQITNINNIVKFYNKDNSKIDIDLNDILDEDKEFIDIKTDLSDTMSLLYSHSLITQDIYTENNFQSIYIDGKNLMDIVLSKRENQGLGKNELEDEAAKTLIKAIRKADKVIEYAEISVFKDTYTVRAIPFNFKYKDQKSNDRYNNTLRKALLNKEKRENKIIERHDEIIKSFVKGIDRTYECYHNIPLADRESKFDDRIANLVKNIDENVKTKPDFVLDFIELCNRVSLDFNKQKVHYSLLKKQELKDVDISPLFPDKKHLRSEYEKIYNTTEIGLTLENYIIRNTNIVKSASIVRDLQRYFIAFNDISLDDRMIKTLKYVRAIDARDGKNKDFTLVRQITDELIDSFLDTHVDMDLNKDDNLIYLNSKAEKSFLIGQLLDKDKEYAKELLKRDKAKYYKVNEARCFYEGIIGDIKHEIRLQSGIRPLKDMVSDEHRMYSKDNVGILETSVNSERNYAGLNKMIIEQFESDKNQVRLDLDMIVYGLKGKDNDLEYERSTNYEDYLEVTVNNLELRVPRYDNSSEDDFNIYPMKFAAIYNVKDMLFNLSLHLEAGDELAKKMKGSNQGFVEYMLSTFSINSHNLLELAEQEKAAHPEYKKLNILDYASTLFTKALNDPNDVITHTNLKFENNDIKATTSVVTKNYDHLVKRCKYSHNIFRRFVRLFGIKYQEEKTLADSISKTNSFLRTNALEDISNHFKDMYQDKFNEMHNELNPSIEEKKDLDKKLKLDLNINKDNVIVNDIENVKEKEINIEK